ncbi:hypothetical protein F6X68_24970 [Micromonospora sp. AMSO12t]|uniref:hypothetical protein n=1 Tax=Micromonospora sp. AMSO12t TaxID=2650410 RepID=UPI00124BA8E7|nr:hypothetical protein [Micromonospora sp. AMSO12t]KAB1138895.1 hypothetical protein F6X68_24970 [Micromonospora sp. AMSO12t]
MTVLDEETRRFVQQAVVLPPKALAQAWERLLDLHPQGGRAALGAVRVSAAQNSEIDNAVRSGLRARLADLDAHSPGLFSDAIVATGSVARAIQARSKLTGEQYQLLTEPFTAVGMAVPEHR